jgi:hypothetical protein
MCGHDSGLILSSQLKKKKKLSCREEEKEKRKKEFSRVINRENSR